MRVQWGPDEDTVVCSHPHGLPVVQVLWHKDDWTTGWISYPSVVMGPLSLDRATQLRDALNTVLEEMNGLVSASDEEADRARTE